MIRIVDAGLVLAGLVLLGVAALLARVFAVSAASGWIIFTVPAVLALICFGGLALGSVARTNLFLSLVAAAAAAYLAQAAIQLGLWTPQAPVQAARAADFDRRTVREVMAGLRQAGKDPHPVAFPWAQFVNRPADSPLALGDLLPLGGISRVTTVFCNETGRYLIYESDEFGFNNPRGIWPAGEIDVLATGDSFTQGACIDNAKNYMGLIRAALPRTVSLGMVANGPLVHLAGLREYLAVVRPRVVLWFLYEGNDIENDLPIESGVALLRRYLEPGFSQRLAARQDEINARLRRWVEEYGDAPQNSVKVLPATMDEFLLPDFIMLRQLRDALSLPFQGYQAEYALFEDILGRAKAETAARGAALHLVYLPELRRFVSFTGRLLKDQQLARVRALAERLNIPVIDVAAAFAAETNPVGLFVGHYTEAGNALVAQTVLKAIAPSAR